jgi:hypothetical protein
MSAAVGLLFVSMAGFSTLTDDVLGLGIKGMFFQFVFALIGMYVHHTHIHLDIRCA